MVYTSSGYGAKRHAAETAHMGGRAGTKRPADSWSDDSQDEDSGLDEAVYVPRLPFMNVCLA
jgi:hypothetical protein